MASEHRSLRSALSIEVDVQNIGSTYIKDRRHRGARFAFILAGGHCAILPGHSFYLNRMSK